MPNIPGKGTDLRLNSPWDVTIVGNNLYVAMAGPHQIWRLGIKTLMAEPWAGSDREDLEGARLKHAALAQPSGITCIDDALYVADSEIGAPWASPPQTASCISRIHTITVSRPTAWKPPRSTQSPEQAHQETQTARRWTLPSTNHQASPSMETNSTSPIRTTTPSA